MPLPPGVQTVRLYGTFLTGDGKPQKGFVKFKPTVTTSGSGVTVPSTPVIVPLNIDGYFSVELPTGTNTGLDPDGWTYTVAERFAEAGYRDYSITLAVSPAEQDISTLSPVPSVSPGITYATTAQLNALAARLSYRHDQLLPNSIWVIVHELGYYPNVQIFDSTGEEIKGVIEHDDDTALTIAFSAATAGWATCS